MTITPDQAQNLLDRATPGLWTRTTMGAIIDSAGKPLVHGPDGNMYDGDATLAAAAPDMAQTIAGMTWEWAKDFRFIGDGEGWMQGRWMGSREDAEAEQFPWFQPRGTKLESRLVRRLVSETAVVEP